MLGLGLRLGFRLRRAYTAEFLAELLYLPVEAIVFYFIYETLTSTTVLVEGYGMEQLTTYLVASLLLRRVYPIGVRREIERDLHDGTLTRYLVRPVGYLSTLYGRGLAGLLILLPPTLALLTISSYLAGNTLTARALTSFTLVLLLGYTVTFQLYALTGLASAWLGRHHWLGNLLTLSTLVLGGGYIPVRLYPDEAQRILELLPLQAVYNLPAETIATQTVNTRLVTAALAWIILLGLLLEATWRKARKRYEAVGG